MKWFNYSEFDSPDDPGTGNLMDIDFLEMLDAESGQGKKLGFIAQEIGREINTLGSKCQDAGMQRLVVQMKDELEKIKEQVLNAL